MSQYAFSTSNVCALLYVLQSTKEEETLPVLLMHQMMCMGLEVHTEDLSLQTTLDLLYH